MAPILGALFAILIGLFAIRPYLDYQQRSFENIRVANTAGQFRQILNAVKSYVQSNYATATGAVTATELAAYLPPNVTLTNPYGQQWNIEVAHDSTGALQALVYSSGGTAIPERLAPEIAAETGAEGGFVPYAGQYGSATSTTAIGAYGYWNLNLNSYNVSPGAGHLVGLLTFGADGALDNSYLYRVNVPGDTNHTLNTMQTNLNMGSHNITNAQTVQVAASGSTPFLAEMADTTSNGLTGGMVETTDQNGDSAIMQADGKGANLSLTGASASNISDDSGSASSLAVDGASSSNLTIGTDSTNPQGLPSSSSQLSVTGASSATVKISSSGASNDSLTLTSVAQPAGSSCAENQIGTIAPSQDGSGIPLVCINNTQNNTLTWQKLGGTFNQSTMSQQVAPNTPYGGTNNSGGPEFLSTYCMPQFSNGLFPGASKFDITIQVNAPNGTNLSTTNGKEYIFPPGGTDGGASGTDANVAPSASAMVPPGDQYSLLVYEYPPTANSYCQLMISY